jgi:hypothetical protein
MIYNDNTINNTTEDNTNNIVHVSDDICPICLEKLTMCVKLSCTHSFHSRCINKWYHGELTNNKKCPICRKPITPFSNKQNNIDTHKQHVICGNLIINSINYSMLFIGLYTIRLIYLYSPVNNYTLCNILNNSVITQINTVFWYIHYLISIILLIFEQKKIFNNQNLHYPRYSLQNNHHNYIDNGQPIGYYYSHY